MKIREINKKRKTGKERRRKAKKKQKSEEKNVQRWVGGWKEKTNLNRYNKM